MSSFQSTLRAEHDPRRHAAVDGDLGAFDLQDQVTIHLADRRDLGARGESESRQEPAGLLFTRDPDDRTALADLREGDRHARSTFLLVAAFDAVVAVSAAYTGLLSTMTHVF